MLTFGCYDDTDLRKELQDHENRISELETLCKQFNTNISSLQIAVSGLEKNVYVSTVAPIKSGQDEIGYVITFTDSQSITIYHGNDGKNGIDGNDGASPALGVKKDNDNVYYWTLNGEWLTDSDGNKIQASGRDGMNGTPGQNGTNGMNGQDGITPQLKIVDGYWYVSYDGGKNWESETLGQATGDKGYTMFDAVTYDADFVYITMAGGEKLTLPRVIEEEPVEPATVTLSEVTGTTAQFDGHVNVPENELPYLKVTIYYSTDEFFSIIKADRLSGPYEIDENLNFSLQITGLKVNREYNYCVCVETRTGMIFSEVQTFHTLDISVDGKQWQCTYDDWFGGDGYLPCVIDLGLTEKGRMLVGVKRDEKWEDDEWIRSATYSIEETSEISGVITYTSDYLLQLFGNEELATEKICYSRLTDTSVKFSTHPDYPSPFLALVFAHEATVSSDKITIEALPYILTDKTVANVSREGGQVVVKLTANCDWTASVSPATSIDNVEGITIENASGKASSEAVEVVVNFVQNDSYQKVVIVSFVAEGVSVDVKISQEGVLERPLEKLTIEQFLARSVDSGIWYEITGTIRNLANQTYGNFYLEDETGSVYVYGLTKEKVERNDRSFASIGLKEGDVLTLRGTRSAYNGDPQVGGPSYYVSHVPVIQTKAFAWRMW